MVMLVWWMVVLVSLLGLLVSVMLIDVLMYMDFLFSFMGSCSCCRICWVVVVVFCLDRLLSIIMNLLFLRWVVVLVSRMVFLIWLVVMYSRSLFIVWLRLSFMCLNWLRLMNSTVTRELLCWVWLSDCSSWLISRDWLGRFVSGLFNASRSASSVWVLVSAMLMCFESVVSSLILCGV